MWALQVEEQEKEMSAAEAAGVHQSTVLKAQERALQERQRELDAARTEMAANVRLNARSLADAPLRSPAASQVLAVRLVLNYM